MRPLTAPLERVTAGFGKTTALLSTMTASVEMVTALVLDADGAPSDDDRMVTAPL